MDNPESEETPRALEAFRDYTEAELSSEWLRKTSFETRVFSIVTSNLAMATLFIAISEKISILGDFTHGLPGTLALAALIGSALSIFCAIVAARPRRVVSPTDEIVNDLFDQVAASDVGLKEILFEVIDLRLVQIRQVQNDNDSRGNWLLSSFVLLAIGAGCLVAAIITGVTL